MFSSLSSTNSPRSSNSCIVPYIYTLGSRLFLLLLLLPVYHHHIFGRSSSGLFRPSTSVLLVVHIALATNLCHAPPTWSASKHIHRKAKQLYPLLVFTKLALMSHPSHRVREGLIAAASAASTSLQEACLIARSAAHRFPHLGSAAALVAFELALCLFVGCSAARPLETHTKARLVLLLLVPLLLLDLALRRRFVLRFRLRDERHLHASTRSTADDLVAAVLVCRVERDALAGRAVAATAGSLSSTLSESLLRTVFQRKWPGASMRECLVVRVVGCNKRRSWPTALLERRR